MEEDKNILQSIIQLSIKYPNDSELGKHIRLFLKSVDNQPNTKISK